MSIRIADRDVLAAMAKAEKSVPVYSAGGDVIGVFTPIRPAKSPLEPTASEEELRRREQRTDGRTLAEIMADLEKRV